MANNSAFLALGNPSDLFSAVIILENLETNVHTTNFNIPYELIIGLRM